MDTKLKKLTLSQETLKNLTHQPSLKDNFITRTCPQTNSCPTECACPPPRV